jgi:hypothetical protein
MSCRYLLAAGLVPTFHLPPRTVQSNGTPFQGISTAASYAHIPPLSRCTTLSQHLAAQPGNWQPLILSLAESLTPDPKLARRWKMEGGCSATAIGH